MTCPRVPVAETGDAQIPVAIECCDPDLSDPPVQTLVSWLPIDEMLKAAMLNPWDGINFIGPESVTKTTIVSSGGGGNNYQPFDPPDNSQPPLDGGDGFIDEH